MSGLSKAERDQPCTWSQDGDDSIDWDTSCRGRFRLEEGSPADNKMMFCCFCGGPLISAPFSDETD